MTTYRLSFILAAAISATAPSAMSQVLDPLVPGELMVRVRSNEQLAACLATLGQTFASVGVIGSIESRQTYLVSYALSARQTPLQVDALLLQLQAGGTILWGELNYEGQAAEGKTDSLWVSQLGVGAPQYQSQYPVPLLGLPAAHARSTGLGIVVAVLDTGVDAAHPALAAKVLATGANFVSSAPAGSDSGDGIDNDNDGLTDEMTGHGTFVAGLITLTAPDARILPVTVLNSDGIGSAFQVGQGLYWAIDHGARVVNMSLGSTYKSTIVEEGVNEAEWNGIVVVGAAGNWNIEEPREFPACDSSALGTAAVDVNDLKAPFSNYNSKLDFSAPGHSETISGSSSVFDVTKSIISTVPDGGYAIWRGTSFATAFVSGTAALIRAQHPTWPDAGTPAAAIVPAISATMAASAVPIDQRNPLYEGMLGAGRIDAAAATLAGPIQPKLGDLNFDGHVDAADLAVLLGVWGPCPNGCAADLDFNGVVDPVDLAIVLGAWS